MRPLTTRRLLSIHRICGLIIALNLVFFAATGLVLVFADELEAASQEVRPEPPAAEPEAPLSTVVAAALAARPGTVPVLLLRDPEQHPGLVFVSVAAGSRDMESSISVAVDAHDATVVEHGTCRCC